MTRQQARARLIRNNRRGMKKLLSLLADQQERNEHRPDAQIDVDKDGILSLCVAWLDQQYEELKADVFPLSDPPPRLAKYLESLA